MGQTACACAIYTGAGSGPGGKIPGARSGSGSGFTPGKTSGAEPGCGSGSGSGPGGLPGIGGTGGFLRWTNAMAFGCGTGEFRWPTPAPCLLDSQHAAAHRQCGRFRPDIGRESRNSRSSQSRNCDVGHFDGLWNEISGGRSAGLASRPAQRRMPRGAGGRHAVLELGRSFISCRRSCPLLSPEPDSIRKRGHNRTPRP